MSRISGHAARNSQEIQGRYAVNAEGCLNAVVVSGSTGSILLRRTRWWVYSPHSMKTTCITESGFKYRRPLLAGTIRVLWNAVRLPVAATLLLLEPLVAFVCGAGLVLGVLACVLFEMSAAGPRFPLTKALGISLCFGVILFLYYGLLSLFVTD